MQLLPWDTPVHTMLHLKGRKNRFEILWYFEFMQAQGAYAHYSIGVSGISISLSWPPSISINFSKSPYAVYR